MKTLLILPHLDDEAISCAGLIQARMAAGGDVGVMFVYGRRYGPFNVKGNIPLSEVEDMDKATDVLGITTYWLGEPLPEGEPGQTGYYNALDKIETVLQQYNPDEVVTPLETDLNQDHQHLAHVTRIALRPINLGSVKRVLAFHGLDGTLKQPNYFVPMTREALDKKLAAVACYRRESRTIPSPRAPENIEAQARVWGSAAGVEYAEAYTLIKQVEGPTHARSDHGWQWLPGD